MEAVFFFVGGRVVSDKQCGLSLETIKALVCLKDWNIVDTRQQEAELAKAFEQLKLVRLKWMPRSYKIYVTNYCNFFLDKII